MNKIDQQLAKIKKEKRLGLMTHVVVGYPSLTKTIALVKLMEKAGVDLVELQIPFSDPICDGPTIMKACEQSLANGARVKDAFSVMEKLSKEVSIPLLFMAYYNTIFKYGTKKFCLDAKKAGASGLIVPDMPIEEEEQEHFIEYCRKYELHDIRVVSPVSSERRLRKNAQVANGFVYCVSRQGITGAQKTLAPELINYLKKARSIFSVPLAVGFGISQREHLQALSQYTDMAVVGSALIDIINKSDNKTLEKNVEYFIKSLKMVN